MEIYNFGKNLRRIRTLKDISQERLANQMDIPPSRVTRIERGKELPDSVFIGLAAEHLEVSPKELMPPGWDQTTKVKAVYGLTRQGIMVYRCMLGAFTYDIARGFCVSQGIDSEPEQVAVLLFVAAIAVAIDYFTERQWIVDE